MTNELRVEYRDKDGVRWKGEKIFVDYTFGIEERSWGIKNIGFSLFKIGLGKEIYENFDEEEDREIEKKFKKNKTSGDWL